MANVFVDYMIICEQLENKEKMSGLLFSKKIIIEELEHLEKG